jgi:hypothetical protein
MNEKEKPSEVRHYEHEEFLKRMSQLEARDEERTNTVTTFIATQSDFMANMKADMIDELRMLERGISEKTSMDSGIIVRQVDQEKRLDRIETSQNDTAHALDRTISVIERMEKDQEKSLKAAHDAIRDHEDRITILQSAGGKTAIAAWKYIGGTILGSIVIGVAIALISGRLHL